MPGASILASGRRKGHCRPRTGAFGLFLANLLHRWQPLQPCNLRRIVCHFFPAARALCASLAIGLSLPATAFAQQKSEKKLESIRSGVVEFTPIDRRKGPTIAGNYLAARHASVERDAGAAASFYRSALREDPKNTELLDRAFISTLADGDIDEAVKLAEKILQTDKANRIARLVVGVRALKQKQYAAAQQNINQSVRGPITDLVAALLSGWAVMGAGDVKVAAANIDKLAGPEWYPIFKDLHVGLMYDLANKPEGSGPAARARLQARRFRAAGGGFLWPLAVAQRQA